MVRVDQQPDFHQPNERYRAVQLHPAATVLPAFYALKGDDQLGTSTFNAPHSGLIFIVSGSVEGNSFGSRASVLAEHSLGVIATVHDACPAVASVNVEGPSPSILDAQFASHAKLNSR
jgi:hypothetical protein